jgi:hypothetical protein
MMATATTGMDAMAGRGTSGHTEIPNPSRPGTSAPKAQRSRSFHHS